MGKDLKYGETPYIVLIDKNGNEVRINSDIYIIMFLVIYKIFVR